MSILKNLRIVGNHFVVFTNYLLLLSQIKNYNQNIEKLFILFLFLKIIKSQVMLQYIYITNGIFIPFSYFNNFILFKVTLKLF
jgi:hypothetical protein